MDLGWLKLNEDNPRKITQKELDKIAESIARDPEFMELRPIVCDNQGVVRGGNQRFKALRLLGYQEVPDSWVVKAESLTDDQLRRFQIVDNSPPGMSGVWDIKRLLNEWDQETMEQAGFNIKVKEFASQEENIGKDEGEREGKFQEGEGRREKEDEDSQMIICPSCGGAFYE